MCSASRDVFRSTLTRAAGAIAAGVLTLLCATARHAVAQVDPTGDVRTITTQHVRVHFRAELAVQGARAAQLAEAAYAQLARELVPPAGKIDLLLADNVDYSNGFAQTFPTNRVVVYATPPIGAAELRFHDEWLRLVITHELTHIFHLDRARGWWNIGRMVFGRDPLFFPNGYTPSWMKEGIAVHYESLLTGSGRIVSTEFRTVQRTAARDGEIPALNRWSAATTRFPLGQTPYAYGSLLIEHASHVGGDSSVKGLVESIARFPIPLLLNHNANNAFGVSFSTQFDTMRDSLKALAAAMDTSGDIPWRVVSNAGWFAQSPRWITRDSLLWPASNGRDVAGLFVADVRTMQGAGVAKATRIARRNALDANAPLPSRDGVIRTLFAQIDYRNPYEVRSDLYEGTGAHERRLTEHARLLQPDVRADGGIVAIQLNAGSARLVRVYRHDASPASVTPIGSTNVWSDPEWSADGTRIAAVEFLPNGEERVVVMDSLGVVQQIVTGARAVFGSPTFTPDGRRLVWASDRSGAMQLETAPLNAIAAPPDTLSWRMNDAATRGNVRVASRVTRAIYSPSVSPDGIHVAAVMERVKGFEIVVAPLDTLGAIVRNVWYPQQPQAVASLVATVPPLAPSTSYALARQLLPYYWVPQVGTGRDGQSTYGFSTSAVDILERHAWSADALIEPERGEIDGAIAYRYRGLGVPSLDLSVSQSWDATFGVVDSLRRPIGSIGRRRRFATASASFSRARIRTSLSAALGVQYELRDFNATVDSLLGSAGSLLRTGTRYPSVFASAGFSNARRGGGGISIEEGVSLSASSVYRWRQDAPSLGAWRHSATARAYVPLNLPGFSRHVLMTRVAGAFTSDNAQTELSVGGVSGASSELVPGVVIGDPSRTFPVRGVVPGAQRGSRALGASVEYRAPLMMIRNAPAPLSLFADRLSLTVFSDAARAWCPGALAKINTTLCERPGERDGWIASAGAEIVLDMAVQYDAPFRLRFGVAAPYVAPAGIARGGSVYVTLGTLF